MIVIDDYLEGLGVLQDYTRALDYFQQAHAAGDAQASVEAPGYIDDAASVFGCFVVGDVYNRLHQCIGLQGSLWKADISAAGLALIRILWDTRHKRAVATRSNSTYIPQTNKQTDKRMYTPAYIPQTNKQTDKRGTPRS